MDRDISKEDVPERRVDLLLSRAFFRTDSTPKLNSVNSALVGTVTYSARGSPTVGYIHQAKDGQKRKIARLVLQFLHKVRTEAPSHIMLRPALLGQREGS